MRDTAIGVVGTLAGLCVLAVAGAPMAADLSIIGPVARIAEGLTVHFWLLAVLLALALLGLRAEATGLVLLLVLITLAGLFGWRHVTQTERLSDATGPGLRIVWFNLLNTNKTAPDAILAALRASDADVIVLTELAPIAKALDRLDDVYPHRFDCGARCGMLVLSRLPFAQTETVKPGAQFPQRRLRVDLVPDGAAPVSIVAGHLLKPWFIEAAYADRRRLARMADQAGDNVVVLGDFNAAPWSLPVQQVIGWAGLTAPFRPRPSWPAPVFWAGVPLDHVLWRGGVKVTGLHPFGGDLGSNHRGLLVDIVLPTPASGG